MSGRAPTARQHRNRLHVWEKPCRSRTSMRPGRGRTHAAHRCIRWALQDEAWARRRRKWSTPSSILHRREVRWSCCSARRVPHRRGCRRGRRIRPRRHGGGLHHRRRDHALAIAAARSSASASMPSISSRPSSRSNGCAISRSPPASPPRVPCWPSRSCSSSAWRRPHLRHAHQRQPRHARGVVSASARPWAMSRWLAARPASARRCASPTCSWMTGAGNAA